VKAREFKIRAAQARAWASRWAIAAENLPFRLAVGAVRGVSSPSEARHMATEWHARAELAEAYAKRAAEVRP
jgi:hypothetical protein